MSGNLLPRNYLKAFISLIKSAFQRADENFYNEYYLEPKLKPFTFSVYFPELKGNEGTYLNVGEKIKFNFSSNNHMIITYLYNSFLEIKEYPIFDNKIFLQKIILHPPKKIHGTEKIFKTLSPFLVNNKGDSNKFLWPEEEGFYEGLIFSIKECANEFLNKEVTSIDFEPLQMRKLPVYHYQKMPTNKGLFKLKADEEILQMVYDVGIGVHRSQGFGMLEVVK